MTQNKLTDETLTLYISTTDIFQLGDPGWHKATLSGYFGERSSYQPDIRVPATLSPVEVESESDKVCELEIDRYNKLHLTIVGWNLVRCALDTTTTFEDAPALAGEHAEQVRKLGIGTLSIASLDWLSQWVSLPTVSAKHKIPG